MNVCGVVRSLVDMVFDAVEAVMFAFDDPAERVFGDADRLADTEAEEEVAEPADNYQLYECTQPTCGCHEDSRYAPLPHISTAFPPSSPAPASAGDEPPSRSVPAPDVEREGMELDQGERHTIVWALRKMTLHVATAELHDELLRIAQKLDAAT